MENVSIYELDDNSLRCILEFLPGQFRFVSAVDKRFQKLYRPHGKSTSRKLAMPSEGTLQVWLAEDTECGPKGACAVATKFGDIRAIGWLRAQNPPCEWGEFVCHAAAQHGQLDTLVWLRAQNPPCPWNWFACLGAAMGGHLHVLQWLREQTPPCPWDALVCAAAADQGNLAMLQWLRAQAPPCPWDEDACRLAAESGHLSVLIWLRGQNPPCPWNVDDVMEDVNNEVQMWVRSQPWDEEENQQWT